MKKIRIWDLPLRAFHWLLVISVVALVVTSEIGGNAIEWHFKIGYFVLEYKIVGDLEFYTRTKNIIIPEYFETVTANMLNEGLSSLVFQAQNEAKKLKLKRKLLPKYLIYWNFYKSVTIGYLKKIKSELYIILNFK